MTDDWKERLTRKLEPLLVQTDPRPGISTYHDMPYAVFLYPPEEEIALRRELRMLQTRLETTAGKRVRTISLAECMAEALEAEGLDAATLAETERTVGLTPTLDTIHQVLSQYHPLDDLVASKVPRDADPLRDIVFIVRAGALFPVYRTSSLLEQMKGKVHVPAVLFYPGERDGVAGLKFMGVLDADHNYPRIY